MIWLKELYSNYMHLRWDVEMLVDAHDKILEGKELRAILR
jgi:hypothetical protein